MICLRDIVTQMKGRFETVKVNVVSFSFVVALVGVATSLRTYPIRLIISFIEDFESSSGVVARLERAVASSSHGGSQVANAASPTSKDPPHANLWVSKYLPFSHLHCASTSLSNHLARVHMHSERE